MLNKRNKVYRRYSKETRDVAFDILDNAIYCPEPINDLDVLYSSGVLKISNSKNPLPVKIRHAERLLDRYEREPNVIERKKKMKVKARRIWKDRLGKPVRRIR